MTVRGLTQRVDLDLGCILVLEDLVKVNEDVRRLGFRALSLETKLLRDAQSLLFAETLLKVDGRGDNGFRVLRGDLLNVHATLGGGDQYRSADTTVI